jgi:hypothetical protein
MLVHALWLVMVMGGGTATAAAQEYCSIIVKIVGPADNVVSGVWVEAREGNGRVESRVAEQGEVRFCDLGTSGVTITVGSGGCQAITANVPTDWGRTLTIKMVYDPQPCRLDSPPPILPCSVLLRFSDTYGRWIPGVHLEPPLPRFPNLVSDSYGRAMVSMAKGEESQATAVKAGYQAEAVQLKCSGKAPLSERTVVLRKSQ